MKRFLTYEEMTKALDGKMEELRSLNFSEIVAVVRGGLTAAHYIAKQLRLPVGVYYPSNDAYPTPRLILAKKNPSRLLFVEDLVAKGRTYLELKNFLDNFPEIEEWHFMPICTDAEYPENFNLQVMKASDWIVFPYEKMESVKEGDRGFFRKNTDVYGL
jgi:hypoxanthine phosphoribosyltransferase